MNLRTHTEVLAEHVALRGCRVLDVGCGSGVLSRWLRSQGAEVTGLECGPAALAEARAADPDHADRYVEGVGQSLPFENAAFDAVVYSYSLHHVPVVALDTALAEAFRVLRAGGLLYVVEPVAGGPSFEVVRIVEDESAVRAEAQAALGRAGQVGFNRRARTRYTSELVHPDVASMVRRVVGNDPSRATALAANRGAFEQRFAAHGRRVPTGWAFTQDNLVEVLAKP